MVVEDRFSGDSMSEQMHDGQIDGSPRQGGNDRGLREKRRLMLTQILKSPVLNPAGDELGRLEDLIVKLGEGGYPPVTGLKVRIGGSDVYVGMQGRREGRARRGAAEQQHAEHGGISAAPRRGAPRRRRVRPAT